MSTREPIINIPGPALALLAVIVGLHLVRLALPIESDEWLVVALAFIPGRYWEGGETLPGGETARFVSFLTHAFVHGNAMHLLFNSIWLTVFGSLIARRIGGARFFLFFSFCAAMGAAIFLLFNPDLFAPVVGASGAISGLMGAAMRILVSALATGRLAELRSAPAAVPLMPLGAALRDRRLLLATAIWLLLNVLAVLGFGHSEDGATIAWEAHAGGYIAGLLTFGLFDVQLRNEPSINPLHN